jgi:hypothetical protein
MLTDSIETIRYELKCSLPNNKLSATVENVKRTCFEAANFPDCPITIDEDKLTSFIDQLDIQKVKRSSHLMDNPNGFPNEFSEVNFHINLHLFNFGHGFRHPLHNTCGYGAWQTMKKGVFALHNDAKNGYIDAETLTNLTVEKINHLFKFPSNDLSCDGEQINLLRNIILQVAHATGSRLVELGYDSFADFIFDHSSRTQPSAQRLVEKLAEYFSAFDDRRLLSSGKEVLFLKKAQIAIAELFQKLGDNLAGQISFADINQFTVACDNVLPCVLRTLGIIKLAPELETKINNKQPLPAGDEEAYLRAVAITSTEIILKKLNRSFWSKELGDYLWALGKDPEFRKVERHATTDTCFY